MPAFTALLIGLLLLAPGVRCAGEPDPVGLLGMDLAAAAAVFGAPDQVYPVRGEAAWQDDVVFRYKQNIHLFWFKDRVWQVRLDGRYAGSLQGLAMAASREDVEQALGRPMAEDGDWMLYHFAGSGFPIRVRLFFGAGGLEDVYIFRADF